PRPERSLGEAAVAPDDVGGEDVVRDEPLALAPESRSWFVDARTGPWRQRGGVQRPGGGTPPGPRPPRGGPTPPEGGRAPTRGRRRAPALRLPPHDVRGWHGCYRHRPDLAIGAGLLGVDLQEHVADAQGRALTLGDDNLDLLHVTHLRSRRPGRPC